MLSLVVLIIGFIPSGFAEVSPGSRAGVEACERALQQPLNPSLALAEFEVAIERAKTKAEAECLKAQRILEAEAIKLKILKQATLKVEPELNSLLNSADQAVDLRLISLSTVIDKVEAIPNQISDENNNAFRSAERTFQNARGSITALKRSWDSLFKPAPKAAILQITAAAQDQALTAETRRLFSEFISKVPAYFLGKVPAPRKKLQFVDEQVLLTSKVLIAKKSLYSAPFKRDLHEQLKQNLQASIARADAGVIKAALTSEFSYQNLNWARLAVASGACHLAATVMQEQLELLEAFPDFSVHLEADIVVRRNFLRHLRCNIAEDTPKILASVKRWQRTLPTICSSGMKAHPDIERSVDDLLVDIANSNLPQLISADTPYVQAELWSMGYQLATTCQGGT